MDTAAQHATKELGTVMRLLGQAPVVPARDFAASWSEGMRYTTYVSCFAWTTIAVMCTGEWGPCPIVYGVGAVRYCCWSIGGGCTSARRRWAASFLELASLVACVHVIFPVYVPGAGTFRFLLVNHAIFFQMLCVFGTQCGDAWRLAVFTVIVTAAHVKPIMLDAMQPHEELLYVATLCSIGACLWHCAEHYLRGAYELERERECERERFFEERERLLREKHRLQYDFAIASKRASQVELDGAQPGQPGLTRRVVAARTSEAGSSSERTCGSLISPSPSLSDTMIAYHKYRGFSPVQVLGYGSSGVVVLMQQDGKYVVSKRINTIDMTGTSLVRVENEVRILKSLSGQSRHIIHYLDSFQEMGMMCIILEFAEAGTLHNAVQQHRARGLQLPPAAVHVWLYQLASALQLLHQSAVLHRDIKLKNIFLTRLGDVKLGDFGLARPLEDEAIMAETACGTPYYLSPEKVRGLPYSKPADLWALGVVLYEILAFRRPFQSDNLAALSGLIQTCKVDEAPMLAAGYAPELTTLATPLHLLHPDPEQRLTVTALLGHLRLHAGASGLGETHLSEGHEDCRQAALVGMQGLALTERLPSVGPTALTSLEHRECTSHILGSF